MPSRARLMASSATRWVRWRTKVKAHVLALICPSHRMLLGLGAGGILALSWPTRAGRFGGVERPTRRNSMGQCDSETSASRFARDV